MNQRVTSTITAESSLPIPIEVRERLGLAPGSVVTFLLSDDEVVLLGAAASIEDLFGVIPARAQTSADFDDEIEDAIEDALRDYGR